MARARKNRQAWDYLVGGTVPPPPRAKPVQRELQHQKALWQWVRLQWWQPYFFHWGNERWSEREAHHLAGTGVKPGPWDNWLFLPRSVYTGCVIELKAPAEDGKAKGRLSKAQTEFGERCLPPEYWYRQVAFGVDEAIEAFNYYVALPAPPGDVYVPKAQ
jgi:hypothetical protein